MDIQVKGHNNRVAGRDYLELNAQLNLTPEQLRELAVKPCPSCEVRLVTARAQCCNHCLREQVANEQKFKVGVFAVLVFMVWGWLLQRSPADGNPLQLLETFVGACGLVFVGTALYVALREWWLFNGDEVLAGLWQLVKQLVGKQ